MKVTVRRNGEDVVGYGKVVDVATVKEDGKTYANIRYRLRRKIEYVQIAIEPETTLTIESEESA